MDSSVSVLPKREKETFRNDGLFAPSLQVPDRNSRRNWPKEKAIDSPTKATAISVRNAAWKSQVRGGFHNRYILVDLR